MRISDWSSDVCSSNLSRIIGDFTLPKVDGVVFSLNGRTDAGEDMGGDAANPNPQARKGTLTVEPGVTVFGSAGAAFLMVNPGSQIFAEGTAPAPVVFTTRQSLEDTPDTAHNAQRVRHVLRGSSDTLPTPATPP